MKLRTPILFITALLSSAGARAQSSTPAPQQQQVKPHDPFEDDPAFKRLPPEQQEMVRKIMENTKAAIDAERSKPVTPPTAAPAIPPMPPVKPAPPAPPTGCAAAPVKPPKFHIPKALQDAINKQVKQTAKQTGVDLDPNAPAQAVKDAQKNIPCPPAIPAPGTPSASK
jgi:hypothetical protein